jgi:hypothetical protein
VQRPNHADQPPRPPSAPNLTQASPPPTHPDRANPAPVDRQALIYAAVLRQYLTSGGGHDGGDAGFGGIRFPRVFVLDHAAAGGGLPSWQAAAGGAPISPAVRRAITQALADVGPVTFVPSPDAVIVDGCAHVRDRGILITLGSVDGSVTVSRWASMALSAVLVAARWPTGWSGPATAGR